MNKHKKTITSIILSLISFSSFSQVMPIIKAEEEINIQNNENQKGYSSSQISTLDELLSKQDYISFYSNFEQMNVGADKQIEYLFNKRMDGHIPLYWLMADYYAKTNQPAETHKWLFIATILTQEDAELCTDPTSRYASQKLLKAFPAANEIVRRTPQYTNDAMREVIFFIQNLRVRSNPIWVCNFGEKELKSTDNVLISKDLWDMARKKVFDKYTADFAR